VDLNQALEECEVRLILQALERTGGNKAQAASLLHLNRTTLVEKLRKRELLRCAA
jgi:DNA-binding NtrC family response regulator